MTRQQRLHRTLWFLTVTGCILAGGWLTYWWLWLASSI